MRKYLVMLACLLIFTIVSPNESDAANFREVKQATASTPLRVAASPSAKVVTTLPKGTLVTQFSTVAGGWSYVQANNYKGYVPTKSLTTPKSTIKIASSKSGLVVKETASRNAKTVATLKYNMIVEDFGSVGAGWSFVQYGNVTGYVSTSFIGTAKTTTQKVKGTGSYIVRNIASPSGAQKGTVKGGTSVTVHSQIAGWSYITTGALRGYIASSQLVSSKPAAQTQATQKLTTFTHLRPTKMDWMQFYMNITDASQTLYSGYVEMNSYDHSYSVETMNYSYDYPSVGAYYSYSPNGYMMGQPGTDWVWYSMNGPMTQNKGVPFYDYVYDGDDYKKVQLGNSFLRTTTGKVTTPAGSFTNVVQIEQKFFNYNDTIHFYFAPGYGLVKAHLGSGKLLFELRSYY